MKKQLINEAFRLQQLAGIKPVNSLNENTPGFDTFMDAVDDTFEPGTPENKKLANAVLKALDNGELEVNQYGVDDAYGQVEKIAKELGLVNTVNEEETLTFDNLKPGMVVHPANHPDKLMTVIVVKDPEYNKVKLKGKDGKEYIYEPEDLVLSSDN